MPNIIDFFKSTGKWIIIISIILATIYFFLQPFGFCLNCKDSNKELLNLFDSNIEKGTTLIGETLFKVKIENTLVKAIKKEKQLFSDYVVIPAKFRTNNTKTAQQMKNTAQVCFNISSKLKKIKKTVENKTQIIENTGFDNIKTKIFLVCDKTKEITQTISKKYSFITSKEDECLQNTKPKTCILFIGESEKATNQ